MAKEGEEGGKEMRDNEFCQTSDRLHLTHMDTHMHAHTHTHTHTPENQNGLLSAFLAHSDSCA